MTPARATLSERLGRRELLIGCTVSFASAEIVELVGLTGYDFVTIDLEHEPMTDESVVGMIRAADALGLPSVIRSPLSERAITLLNAGAAGLQVPDVAGVDHVREIVDAVRFPPAGHRSIALVSRWAKYGLDTTSPPPAVIAMVEDIAVTEQLHEIASVPGVDAIYIGPADLKASIDASGGGDLQQVIDGCVEIAVEHGRAIAVGVLTPDRLGTVPDQVAKGVSLFNVMLNSFLVDAIGGVAARVKQSAGSGAEPLTEHARR